MTNRERKILNQLGTRHGRRKSPLFLVEGVRCCREALSQCPEWLGFAVCSESFAQSSEAADMESLGFAPGRNVEVVPDADFEAFSITDNPQGILCVMRQPAMAVPDTVDDPVVLLLDGVREPGNMGTMLRTAWAMGLHSVWLTQGSADPFAPKVIRAGMGAQFGLALVRVADLDSARRLLSERGIAPFYCAVPRGGTSCFGEGFQPRGAAIVIGNEASGITVPSLGVPVSIPMPGDAESLNAAQAATVLLVETVRRGILGNTEGDPQETC